MEEQLFSRFQRLVLSESGISLSPAKKALIENRIRKRIRALGLHDERDYLHYLEKDSSGDELIKLVDVISTNVTAFYREPAHFVKLADILKQWARTPGPEIKIWCAASSTGEEPYTISMTAHEALAGSDRSFRILASDICLDVLRRALVATYTGKQVENIPGELLKKYFSPVTIEGTLFYRAGEQLTRSVLFKRLNLSRFPYPLRGPLDVIFCRNVMIYFAPDLRAKVIGEFTRLLAPGGYLFVGHSESLAAIPHTLKTIATAVYQKPMGQ